MPAPTAAASSGRAARCSAGPRRSTAWSISAASTRTSTSGASSATPAGRPPTCCPISSAPQHQTRGASEFHSTGGPLCVSDTSEHHPICEAFIEGAMRPRLSAQRRFQRREAGRRRLPPDHHAQRQALLDRGRLPASGAQPAQPARRHRRAGREGAVRWQARGRRRVPRIRPAAHRARHARGDPVRRRGELAAASAAVRCRAAGTARTVRHRCGAPSARRRPKSAGSLLGADQAEVPSADHRQRRDAEQRQEAEGRAAILPVRHRPAHHGRRPRRLVRAHPRRNLPRRT